MHAAVDSTDSLVLNVLPEHNPDPTSRNLAWDDLIDPHAFSLLVQYVDYRNGTPVPTEDIVQEALVTAWQKVEQGAYTYRNVPFLAYVISIARYKIKEAARERPQAALEDLEDFLADPHAEIFIGDEALKTAIEELPARRRMALLCSIVLDMTSDEIAHDLHLRADLVRKDKSLALQHLRRVLAPEGDRAYPIAA